MKQKGVTATEGQRVNVLGDNQVIKLTGKDTNGQLAVVIQNLPPGTGVPKHVHSNDDEHFHLLEGEVHFEVGDEEYNWPGDGSARTLANLVRVVALARSY